MSPSTRLALGVLGGSAVLGLLGDLLLRELPWGLNAPLFVGALLALAALLVRRHGLAASRAARWLALPAFAFALAIAWRDSATLKVCGALAVMGTLALGATYLRAGRLVQAGLVEYLLGGLTVGLHAVSGWLPLTMIDVKWRELSASRAYALPLAVTRGVVLALPLLLVFGGLFVAADAAFEGLVTTILRWSPVEIIQHLFLIGFWAWIVGGALRCALLTAPWPQPRLDGVVSLGIVDLGVVLGLLDALFLAFVLVQSRYFFGGAGTVLDPSGPTYAEYARRGFFELVTVVALALPLLLLGHWLLRKERLEHVRLFTILAGGLIGLIFVIIGSALSRMWLYTQVYGLTELRLYTTAFMLWLAVLCLWFSWTVLRGRREQFAVGLLLSGLAVLAVLDALNPDALIVQVNAGRRSAVEPVDVRYVSRLSADAVPSVVAVLPELPAETRAALAKSVLSRWSAPSAPDPRTWSWGRYQAWLAVENNRPLLEQLAR